MEVWGLECMAECSYGGVRAGLECMAECSYGVVRTRLECMASVAMEV